MCFLVLYSTISKPKKDVCVLSSLQYHIQAKERCMCFLVLYSTISKPKKDVCVLSSPHMSDGVDW